jgi:hypothetical protein
MPNTFPSDFLGLQVTGDLGGVTYVQRGCERRVAYIKTYPSKTPTLPQVVQRLKFRDAVKAYQALDAAHKQALRDIEKRFNWSMSGYNGFLKCYMFQRMNWIEDYAKQIGFIW